MKTSLLAPRAPGVLVAPARLARDRTGVGAVTDQLTVLSLGAGVQSTTMALMAAHGEINSMPDCAIFADTGWGPRAVYDHLAWLRSPNVLPFEVHVVRNGNLRESTLARRNTTGGRFSAVPWYINNPDGSHGMGRRLCVNGGVKWGHRGGVKRGHRRLRACPRSPREGPARDAACPVGPRGQAWAGWSVQLAVGV